MLPFPRRVAAGGMFLLFTLNLLANPTGMTVVSGSATATVNGSQLTVTAGNNASLNWQSFNIGAGERTVFNQPSATSIVFNNIGNQSASQIYGGLQANGVVVLLNSSGFYFGPNSFVSAAGLVVSTANCVPPQNAGGAWQFNGPPPLASIVNYGQINIGNGGSCFFIADKVENHGSVNAPGGSVGFAAGQTVMLSERPDGRGMSMDVLLPQGSVDNDGHIIADGGTIALNARVVNQNGFLQANSVKDVNGQIELVADNALTLGANSQILASGDDSAGGSAGGSVTLKSGNTFSDADGSQIITAGGVNGGNGGNIEVSAPNIQSLASAMDASAQAGSLGGVFLLDPVNIVLGTTGSGTVPANGTVDSAATAGTDAYGNLLLNVNTAFANKNFSQILLQATGNIYVGNGTVNSAGTFIFSSSPGITWNLSSSTGNNAGQLTLEAGGNINFGNNSKIMDANGWAVSLQAGYDFANNNVPPGTGSTAKGNITFSGSSLLQTATGDINLLAGQNITIGSGFVRTSGGGSVSATALAGNINTGTATTGYVFTIPTAGNPALFSVNSGGISTEAGGDVTITAGGNVTSYLPTANVTSDAGTGAFGTQAGNVTVTAGGNVTGHYVVANGAGIITAGANAGLANAKLALSLATGGWTVNAAQDINLQEVRNPNGVFNNASSFPLPASYHYFNYAPDAYVNLNAGNAVVLGDSAAALPRIGVTVPFIYAPILNILAGAGGVTLNGDSDPFDKLILYPSPQGSLTITTIGGGSLISGVPNNADGSPAIFDLIVSDSGQNQYLKATSDTFGLDDHAITPVHENSATPIVLNISGDMDNVLLGSPEAAQINVVGDMNNSRFQGMNLNDNDVTSINVGQSAKANMEASGILNPATDGSVAVGGDIINRSDFTTATVPTTPNLNYLNQVYPPNALATTLSKELFYDPATMQLTIQGPVTSQILALLQNLSVQVYINGVPQVDGFGNPIVQTVSVIDAATATALATAYATAGAIPSTLDSGYIVGGGGTFLINARNIDLGTTLGIQSKGAGLDVVDQIDGSGNTTTIYPLAQYMTQGANIVVNASGNLDLFSTSIASLGGGDVYVNADGDIQVGSSMFTVNTTAARGIYSTGQGNVAVYAGGDINVNGSRIAAFDIRPPDASIPNTPGGSVTVVSRNGDINVGSGGGKSIIVYDFLVDPITRVVDAESSTITGNGILDTSFRQTGNILIETPNGAVNAINGGIVQLLLNNPVPVGTTLFGIPFDTEKLAEIYRLALKGDNQGAKELQSQMNGDLGNSLVSVYAGYLLQKSDALGNPIVDSYGNPIINANNAADGTLVKISDSRDIVAQPAGVISAGSLSAKASGDANINFFALNNVDISANNNVNAAGVGLGVVSVSSASGTISGTIAGVGGVTASGSSIDANLESNGAISGETSGQKGAPQATAANSVATAASANSDADAAAAKSTGTDDEDDLKKKGKKIALAQKVSRVTVILPKKD